MFCGAKLKPLNSALKIMNASHETRDPQEVNEGEDSSFAVEVQVTPETYEALRTMFEGMDLSDAALEILGKV